MFHLYGFVVGIAVVLGVNIAQYIYNLRGGESKNLSKIFPLTFLFGIVFARLYHVIDYLEYYQEYPVKIFYLWEGGLAIWGGIIGGILGICIATFCYAKKERWEILLASFTALPFAQAVGRVANFLNGEFREKVYGVEWWALEMIGNLVIGSLVFLIARKKTKASFVIGTYLVLYGIWRGVIEPSRTQSFSLFSIPVASLCGIISALVGLCLMIYSRRGKY